MTRQTRLNININEQSTSAIREVAEQYSVSKTDAVRRLIGVGILILRFVWTGHDIVVQKGDTSETVRFIF